MRHLTNTAGKLPTLCCLTLVSLLSIGCSDDSPNGKGLYNDFCAEACHGFDNRGTTGSSTSAGPVNIPTVEAIKLAISNEPIMLNTPALGTLRTSEIQAIANYISSSIPPP